MRRMRRQTGSICGSESAFAGFAGQVERLAAATVAAASTRGRGMATLVEAEKPPHALAANRLHRAERPGKGLKRECGTVRWLVRLRGDVRLGAFTVKKVLWLSEYVASSDVYSGTHTFEATAATTSGSPVLRARDRVSSHADMSATAVPSFEPEKVMRHSRTITKDRNCDAESALLVGRGGKLL